MGAPQVLDVEQLLLPISEDQPVGVDPRENSSPVSIYYRVKDARGAARSIERSTVDVNAAPPESWATVVSSATELLSTTAKDLEVAAWLTEALVRLHGFVGLRDGLILIRGLVEHYWETVYPLPDEDGLEGRLAAVAGLNGSGAQGTLEQPLRMVPLFGTLNQFSVWHYDQTIEVDKIVDQYRKQARIEAGVFTTEQLRQSLAETSPEELTETLTTIDECLTALTAMAAAFDAVAGYDAPPTSSLREILEKIAGSIRYFGAGKIIAETTDQLLSLTASGDEAGSASTGDGADSTGGARLRKTDGFASRDEALQVLSGIATYFRKTEPQSPISYTLEEAVRRARMTLPELLQELTQDPTQINYFLLAAGIRGPADTSEQSY